MSTRAVVLIVMFATVAVIAGVALAALLVTA